MRKFALLALVAACNQRAARPRLEWAPDETTAFQRAKMEHRGVIAEGYASWAVQCEEVDRVLHRGDVAEWLRGWVAYREDVTAGDDAATAWQHAHGAETVPFVGFYSADGTELEHASSADELLARAATFRTGTPSSR